MDPKGNIYHADNPPAEDVERLERALDADEDGTVAARLDALKARVEAEHDDELDDLAVCPVCGGRGWHTAGGNEPGACGACDAGEAWYSGVDDGTDDLESTEAAAATGNRGELADGIDEQQRALLLVNGYSAIREQILGAINTLAAIPPDAYTAAEAYNTAARDRLRVDPHAQAGLAGDAAEHEAALLRIGRHAAREARTIAERRAARDRITAR